ncbi:hypothetical protein [Actinoplanes flavus]|uniref:Uncharacterized protein n=1 Tax=Actinoplanes flavus TaxID=2820290 RepID=A0ABS3UH58_9ACTN|nr:hypothetical protein [Actinoplanes flavus]MBO3738104.1 hypothetical protein [Actinoplanes flavus]
MSFSVARFALVLSILAVTAVVRPVTGAGYEQLTVVSAADNGLIWG